MSEQPAKPACLFEVGKIYQTRRSEDRRVVAIDYGTEFPVISRRVNPPNGTAETHTVDGTVRATAGHPEDLIPPAPLKKRVPLGPEDVPPGSVFRSPAPLMPGIHHAPSTVLGDGIIVTEMNAADKSIYLRSMDWDYLKSWKILRPGGEWEPCSKEVSE